MSEFNKAWYVNCNKHKNERFLFFRKCWKCEVSDKAKTISHAKLLIPFKTLLKNG